MQTYKLHELFAHAKVKPIKIKPSHRGLLHTKEHVPQGQPIPAAKVAAAKNSKSPALRREATFAQNAAQWRK